LVEPVRLTGWRAVGEEIMLSPQGEAMAAEFWENYHASFDT
jgi:hypothetical protein